MLDRVDASVPPHIAPLPVPVDGPLAAAMEAAVREIVALDHAHGPVLAPLTLLLLRTESIASPTHFLMKL